MTTYEEYLRKSILTKEEIDLFLDPNEPSWSRFDPELGYVLGNYMPRVGMDGCLTISTSGNDGARTSTIYVNRPCRINTYGNSFTECHQVSDHETWQEYLAAHLGEPIRNFGMGGYGVYQAYRRMVRTEKGQNGTEYAVLYIWGDDHYRSLLRCRHALTRGNSSGGRMLAGNFWANLEIDLQSGNFVENNSLLPTPASLYRMTDPDFMVESLRDDLMLQMSLFCQNSVNDIDAKQINKLADILACPQITPDDFEKMKVQVSKLRDAYAFAATRHIIDQAVDFTNSHGKKLMLVLSCPAVTRQLIQSGKRYDQDIVDYLADKCLRYFDMNLVHVNDYRCFNLTLDEYMKRYFIGHYNPAGNHFFAFAIKDSIVDWLNPKPITYRPGETKRGE